MKIAILAALSALGLAQGAAAQDGFYYGIGLGYGKATTNSVVVSDFTASASELSLALTAGYRFPAQDSVSFGIEGNLDAMRGATMSESSGDACTGISPSWCSVDTVVRLRGTVTMDLANGSRLTTSMGAVMVKGISENGPGNNLKTTGRGVSAGVAWEQSGGKMPVRVDLNYDFIQNDDQPAYNRDVKLIGMRLSYMF